MRERNHKNIIFSINFDEKQENNQSKKHLFKKLLNIEL